MANIFNLPSEIPNRELFEPLVSSNNILIERIVSTGQTTPSGEWYDQEKDEWLTLRTSSAHRSRRGILASSSVIGTIE